MLCEGEGRLLQLSGEAIAAHEFAGGLQGRLAVVLHDIVDLLAVILRKRGLGIERVDLRGAAFAENLDHPLRPRREVRLSGRQRRVGQRVACQANFVQERRQPQAAQPQAGAGEQITAGDQ